MAALLTFELIDVFLQESVLCTSMVKGSLELDSKDASVAFWIDVSRRDQLRVRFLQTYRNLTFALFET